jgi:hypothetical protein
MGFKCEGGARLALPFNDSNLWRLIWLGRNYTLAVTDTVRRYCASLLENMGRATHMSTGPIGAPVSPAATLLVNK